MSVDYHGALEFLSEHINLERGSKASRLPVAGENGSLSLAPIQELLEILGSPQNAYRSIHVTGTNGKGSTSGYIQQIVAATGLSVGLYTSPHLEQVTERLKYGDRCISEEEFAQIIGLLASVEAKVSQPLSWFELVTATAFVWFAECGVDVAVIEVGMLGLFDATNVLDSDVAVVTSIGRDHTDELPGWREKIAVEKAGIIKPSSRVVLGAGMEEERDIFVGKPSKSLVTFDQDFFIDSNLQSVGGRVVEVRTNRSVYSDLFLPVYGDFQGINVAVAIAAAEEFFEREIEKDVLDSALEKVALPGRLEVLSAKPIVLVDSAHNVDGAQSSVAALQETFPRLGSWVLVAGFLQGKDPAAMLNAFDASSFDAVFVCEPDSPRALPVGEVLDAAKGMRIDAEGVRSPIEALHRALAVTSDEDLIFVTGSFYLVGEIRSFLLKDGLLNR